jgi:hypothetical protein
MFEVVLFYRHKNWFILHVIGLVMLYNLLENIFHLLKMDYEIKNFMQMAI